MASDVPKAGADWVTQDAGASLDEVRMFHLLLPAALSVAAALLTFALLELASLALERAHSAVEAPRDACG